MPHDMIRVRLHKPLRHFDLDVDFTVPAGEVAVVVGPSGAGKTSVLNCVAGLDSPAEGAICLGEHTVFDSASGVNVRPEHREVGYVFQDYALVPELTAKENVYLPSMARGMTPQECTLVCTDILGVVGLGDRIHHLPSQMSGGEQQRVAIARALVNRPALLLADEPCANLDTRNSKVILDLFRKLNHDLHQTIVMVSHEEWHKQYFDRIISMTDGVIETDIQGGPEGASGGEPSG